MSKVALSGNASGTGTFTIASPNSNTDRTINLPDSNGTILTTATAGVPVNGPAFSAYATNNQSLASINTFYKVVLNAEEFDTNASFDPATNYRFTPLVAGYYFISAETYFNGSTNPGIVTTSLFKNGAEYKSSTIYGAGSTNGASPVSALIYLNGSTDYVEMYVKYQAVGSAVYIIAGSATTYMTGFLARSAT